MPSPRTPLCICQAGHCDDACEVCAGLDNKCPYREDDNLTVTVTLGDAGSAIPDGGIVRMTGTTEDGRQVVWAGDTRIVADILQALMLGEEDEITVVLEDYQILTISEVDR